MGAQRDSLGRRAARDARGATAVEFAMIAAPFVALLLMSVQTIVVFFMDQVLQSSLKTASRQLMTGSAQNAGTTQAQFQRAVCAAAPAFLCSGLMVDVRSASTFSTLNTAAPSLSYGSNGQVSNAWTYSPGGPGDVVIVRAMYLWPIFGGPFSGPLANQPGGKRLLTGTVVFKNEPYAS